MNFKKICVCAILSSIFVSPAMALKSEKQPEKPVVLTSKVDYLNFDWWKNFNDPYLEEYIARGIEHNHDLKMATLSIEEYKQLVKIQFGKELPMVNVGANYIGSLTMGNAGEILNTGFDDYIFAVPLIVTYEADIYGKNHNKTTSVKMMKQSVEYKERAAYIAVSSLIASTYLNIVQLDKVISLQKDIVSYRKTIYDLMNEQHKYGLASIQDTIAANKAFTASRIQLTTLEKEQNIALNALAVLLGDSADNAGDYKRSSFDTIATSIHVPETISSEIIVNRPDVQSIEAELKKAQIDIKVARKELLPSISLNGALIFNALKLGELVNNSFGLLALAPGMMHTLFAGGQKMANLRLNKTRYEKMLQNYQKTNLIAIQEVNDALVKIKYDRKQDNENASKLNLEKQNEMLARESYTAGAISKLDYTQYKEMLATAERDKVQSATLCLIDYVTLYKAAGAKI